MFSPSKLAPKDAIKRLTVGEMTWPWEAASKATLFVRRIGSPDPANAKQWEDFERQFMPTNKRAGVLGTLMSREAEIIAAREVRKERKIGERSARVDFKAIAERAENQLALMSPTDYDNLSKSDGDAKSPTSDPEATKLRVALCYFVGGSVEGLDLTRVDDRLLLLGFDGAAVDAGGGSVRYYTRRALAVVRQNREPNIVREFAGDWRGEDGAEILAPEDGSDTAGRPLGQALAERILEFAIDLENAVGGEIAGAELDSPASPAGPSGD